MKSAPKMRTTIMKESTSGAIVRSGAYGFMFSSMLRERPRKRNV